MTTMPQDCGLSVWNKALGHEKRSGPKPGAIGQERAAGAEKDFLVDKVDAIAPRRGPQIGADDRSEIMGIDEDTLDAAVEERLKPAIEQGPAGDIDHRLGN
jgi:hypothetical protein